jgi:hypothetical protein
LHKKTTQIKLLSDSAIRICLWTFRCNAIFAHVIVGEDCNVFKFNDAREFARRPWFDTILYDGSTIRHDRRVCDRVGRFPVVRDRTFRTNADDIFFSSSVSVGISGSLKILISCLFFSINRFTYSLIEEVNWLLNKEAPQLWHKSGSHSRPSAQHKQLLNKHDPLQAQPGNRRGQSTEQLQYFSQNVPILIQWHRALSDVHGPSCKHGW